MLQILNWIWIAVKASVVGLFLLFVGGMFLLLFLGAPIALVFETIDLLRMDSQTEGLVTDIEIVRARGSTSATRVTYQFVVAGSEYESQRMYPGYFANHGTYTGGSELADDFKVGQRCAVFYDASAPSHCSLLYGWFKWSVGFSACVWGLVLTAYLREKNRLLQSVAASTITYYGFGLGFFGPPNVNVYELHWHVLAAVVLYICLLCYHLYKQQHDVQLDAKTS